MLLTPLNLFICSSQLCARIRWVQEVFLCNQSSVNMFVAVQGSVDGAPNCRACLGVVVVVNTHVATSLSCYSVVGQVEWRRQVTNGL